MTNLALLNFKTQLAHVLYPVLRSVALLSIHDKLAQHITCLTAPNRERYHAKCLQQEVSYHSPQSSMTRENTIMTEHICYIEQFPHGLPHRDEAELRPCGHYACAPHTITYYGTGDDDDVKVLRSHGSQCEGVTGPDGRAYGRRSTG